MHQKKIALVTGGTGSFGKTMVKHLLKQDDIGEIRILSRDEWKQEEMRIQLARPELKFYIGDVRSRESVDNAMRNVDWVFHAAALKQVPSCEFFPMQAVQTNIIGSYNVLESAIANESECVVCLSTDKAVEPVNAMGMTKAMMEKVAQAAARQLGSESQTRVCAVRYGNVMYSRGSVIPLFIEQIKKNKPITVTEPKMTRFMMPLSESVALVNFAFTHAMQGDIFINKAPACTIQVLIDALKKLFDSSIEVRRIGIRHGEKMHETLASAEELRRAEDLGDYFRIAMDARELNYSKFFTEGDPLQSALEDFGSNNTDLLGVPEMEELLLTLPEVRAELGMISECDNDASPSAVPSPKSSVSGSKVGQNVK